MTHCWDGGCPSGWKYVWPVSLSDPSDFWFSYTNTITQGVKTSTCRIRGIHSFYLYSFEYKLSLPGSFVWCLVISIEVRNILYNILPLTKLWSQTMRKRTLCMMSLKITSPSKLFMSGITLPLWESSLI